MQHSPARASPPSFESPLLTTLTTSLKHVAVQPAYVPKVPSVSKWNLSILTTSTSTTPPTLLSCLEPIPGCRSQSTNRPKTCARKPPKDRTRYTPATACYETLSSVTKRRSRNDGSRSRNSRSSRSSWILGRTCHPCTGRTSMPSGRSRNSNVVLELGTDHITCGPPSIRMTCLSRRIFSGSSTLVPVIALPSLQPPISTQLGWVQYQQPSSQSSSTNTLWF